MKKCIIRSYGVVRNLTIDLITREGLAEVHLISSSSHLVTVEETIRDIHYRNGEDDLTLICRAVMNAANNWDFPWWRLSSRQRLREFRQYNNWGSRH